MGEKKKSNSNSHSHSNSLATPPVERVVAPMEVDSPPSTATSLDDGKDWSDSPSTSLPVSSPPVQRPEPVVESEPSATTPSESSAMEVERSEEASSGPSLKITLSSDVGKTSPSSSRASLPKPVKRKGRDFDASFFEDRGILHIDIHNPEKRQKLEEQARRSLATSTSGPARRASTGTPRSTVPALPARLRNQTFSAVLSPSNVVAISWSPSQK